MWGRSGVGVGGGGSVSHGGIPSGRVPLPPLPPAGSKGHKGEMVASFFSSEWADGSWLKLRPPSVG